MHDCCSRPPARAGGTCHPFGRNQHWGGGSYNRLALSVHPFKQFIAQTTQRRPAVRGGTTPSNVPTTGGWLSFCVSREKLHADLNALLPVFRDRWQFLIQRRPLLCFQERDRPEWKWGFVFFFPLFLLSSLISAASRENYTLLKDAVVFLATCQLKWFLKKLFPSPSAQHLSTDGPVGFPIFTDSQSIFCSACCEFVSHPKRPTKWKQSFWYITTFFGNKKTNKKNKKTKQKLVIKLYPQLANSRQRSPTADTST